MSAIFANVLRNFLWVLPIVSALLFAVERGFRIDNSESFNSQQWGSLKIGTVIDAIDQCVHQMGLGSGAAISILKQKEPGCGWCRGAALILRYRLAPHISVYVHDLSIDTAAFSMLNDGVFVLSNNVDQDLELTEYLSSQGASLHSLGNDVWTVGKATGVCVASRYG